MSSELAEVIGVFIGDGCFSEFTNSNNRRISTVMFTGSWKNDSEYYSNLIYPLISAEFGSKSKPYLRKDDLSVRYFIYKKYFVDWIRNLGFTPGPKAGTVRIPDEILKDRALYLPCIRGIFNTDGCIYRRYSKKYKNHPKHYSTYANIEFRMKSKVLLMQIKELLLKENITSNKLYSSKNGCNILRITDQTSVEKFVKIIGFNHSHHIERYNSIKLSLTSSFI